MLARISSLAQMTGRLWLWRHWLSELEFDRANRAVIENKLMMHYCDLREVERSYRAGY